MPDRFIVKMDYIEGFEFPLWCVVDLDGKDSNRVVLVTPDSNTSDKVCDLLNEAYDRIAELEIEIGTV